MGELLGPALVLAMICGVGCLAWRVALNIWRSQRWVVVEALVCADAADTAKPARWQRPTGLTVLFAGPSGPCIAPLLYADIGEDDAGLPIGQTIKVVYDPDDPSRVEAYCRTDGQVAILLFLSMSLGVFLSGLLRMLQHG